MSAGPFLFLAGLVCINLAVGAVLLWLCCLVAGMRYQVPDASDPTKMHSRRVGLGRAFLVAVAIFLVSILALVPTARVIAASPTSMSVAIALAIGSNASILLSLLAMRWLLPGGWLRCLWAFLLWSILSCVLVPVNVVALWFGAAEGFIVPSGALAETILGEHKDVLCPQCGLAFPVNASIEAESAAGPARHVNGCICPNCRQDIAFVSPGQPAAEPGQIPEPPRVRGDRILAGRGFFGASWLPPRRLDLVVFDWPGDPGQPPPVKPIKYVHRLVGLPGEMVAIHRGKLFILPAEQVPEPSAESPIGFGPDDQAAALLAQGKFHIVRKPPELILGLMRLVHNSDHPPRDEHRQPWQRWTGPGWTEEEGTFVTRASREAAVLTYQHRVAGRNRPPQLITDYLGYNTWKVDGIPLLPNANWASDLILECEIRLGGTEGAFTLKVARGVHDFHAYFNLVKQTCSLHRHGPGKEATMLAEVPLALPQGSWLRLRFANVDDRLVLWVDDRLIFGSGVEYDAPVKLVPVKENDLDRPARIRVAGVDAAVRRLRLYRDVYFTTNRMGNPANADVEFFDPGDPDSWKLLSNAPVAACRVPADSYFVLGDNSAQSFDSRSWGIVPRGMLQGRVLLRYWPTGRIGWLP